MPTLFGRILTNEFRNGVGFDIEFAHSRPVWGINRETGELGAMSFEGVIILLPFFMLSFGRIYSMEVLDDE